MRKSAGSQSELAGGLHPTEKFRARPDSPTAVSNAALVSAVIPYVQAFFALPFSSRAYRMNRSVSPFGTFEQAVRYGLPGGVAVGAILLSPNLPSRLSALRETGVYFDSIGGALLLALTSIVLGSLIYSCHRSVLYPPLRWLAVKVALRRSERGNDDGMEDHSLINPLLEQTELENRLDIRRSGRRQDKLPGPGLRWWGAEIHLLFSCGWALLIAATATGTVRWTTYHSILVVLGIVLATFGLLSCIRFSGLELEILSDEDPW